MISITRNITRKNVEEDLGDAGGGGRDAPKPSTPEIRATTKKTSAQLKHDSASEVDERVLNDRRSSVRGDFKPHATARREWSPGDKAVVRPPIGKKCHRTGTPCKISGDSARSLALRDIAARSLLSARRGSTSLFRRSS
jgi:hypothetical protein